MNWYTKQTRPLAKLVIISSYPASQRRITVLVNFQTLRKMFTSAPREIHENNCHMTASQIESEPRDCEWILMNNAGDEVENNVEISFKLRYNRHHNVKIITFLPPIIENCFQCGGEQRKRSMVARMDFIQEVLSNTREQACILVEV